MPDPYTTTGRRGYVTCARRWLADERLSDSALRLMLWLDSHTDEYLAHLSVTRVATEIGWSRDRVKRTLDQLDDLGLIATTQMPLPASPTRTRTVITLNLDEWANDAGRAETSANEGGPHGTSPMPHDEAEGMPHGEAVPMPHGEAPTTSNPMGRNELSGASRDEVVPRGAGEPIAISLAEYLATGIEARGSKRPTVTATWAADIEKMIRIDGRDPADIHKVIHWLGTSTDEVATFWAPNIRSPRKLREKWDQMREQYERMVRRPATAARKTAPGMDRLREIVGESHT